MNERSNWIDKLPEDVARRLGNCRSTRADIRTLVDVKWAYMCQTGKRGEGFTKEDALVSILDLLDSNGRSFDLSKAEYDSLKHDPFASESSVGPSLDKEVEKLLPEWCYVYVPSTHGLGAIQRGKMGCQEVPIFTPPLAAGPFQQNRRISPCSTKKRAAWRFACTSCRYECRLYGRLGSSRSRSTSL